MQFLQKNQITHLIRDTIAVYALNLAATDYLIDINNTQLRYAIIIIITLSLIYCSFKCFSALIEIILKLITINNRFLNYKRNSLISQWKIIRCEDDHRKHGVLSSITALKYQN